MLSEGNEIKEKNSSDLIHRILSVSEEDLDKYKRMDLFEMLNNLKTDYPDLLIDRENEYFNGKLNLRKMIEMGAADFRKASKQDLDNFFREILKNKERNSIFEDFYLNFYADKDDNDFYFISIAEHPVGVLAIYGENEKKELCDKVNHKRLKGNEISNIDLLAPFPFKIARLTEVLPEARGNAFSSQTLDYYNNEILDLSTALLADYSFSDAGFKVYKSFRDAGYLKESNYFWFKIFIREYPMSFYRKRKDPAYGKPEMKNYPLFLGD